MFAAESSRLNHSLGHLSVFRAVFRATPTSSPALVVCCLRVSAIQVLSNSRLVLQLDSLLSKREQEFEVGVWTFHRPTNQMHRLRHPPHPCPSRQSLTGWHQAISNKLWITRHNRRTNFRRRTPLSFPACVMPAKDEDRDRQRRSQREKDREQRRPRYRSPPSLFEGDAVEKEGSRHSDTRYERRTPRIFHRTRPSELTPRERDRRRAVTGDYRLNSSNLSMPATDSNSRPSSAFFVESKPNLPYPSFSKAHSKEAVGFLGSRENIGQPKVDILTPEPTDLTTGEETNGKTRGDDINPTEQEKASRRHSAHRSPPSPPLTNLDQQSTRRESTTGGNKKSEEKRSATKSQDEKKKHRPNPISKESTSSMRRKSDEGSKTSSRGSGPSTPGKLLFESLQSQHNKSPTSGNTSKSRQLGRSDSAKQSSRRKAKPSSPDLSSVTQVEIEVVPSTVDSDATSIAPNQQPTYQRPSITMRAPSEPHRIPTPRRSSPTKLSPPSAPHSPSTGLPPPPPPPPNVPITIPKVDYLLNNGGLKYHVPRSFFGAGESANMPQDFFKPAAAASKLFEPYNKLLDDYGVVISKCGSLAVATGYRSVARRLLDRLEAVFARDISSESCQCIMCSPTEVAPEGVSWGEVLELVSGRQDLPPWPPFKIAAKPGAADITDSNSDEPMQKMDMDIPEEFREHFVRQSRKTKHAVDKWLSYSNDQGGSPPDEIDDETLMFAMGKRNLFSALLDIAMTPPEPKRETPKPRDRPDAIVQSGAAIQRLYRLSIPPRDPETALYLLKNPGIHHVLATLAAISSDEWDILISGRFDGFLRSGADDDLPQTFSAASVRAPRPGSTRPVSQASNARLRNISQPYGGPSYPSRTSTPAPASFGAPIYVDEDTEIAALAEIERDIYLGMEALEDAFEVLHVKAEAIRGALRERGAGLQVANLTRRGGSGGVEVLSGTPAAGIGGYGLNGNGGWESSTDDGIEDGVSEILPSDSASNISSSRRRRPKRRSERRTPVVFEEEEEGEEDDIVATHDYRTRKKY
ncbi:conserved hypothetical protein [Histoplasma capsulatum var. duboisii H88]|uniref:5-Methylcytosine G/T mismatch-specific DNA glycosylase n=1 Tax=Ajellomyces capsulatus (strain H88) TaxID=544711 RepID=F0UT96_AJEC8|nr:conserved hypothetical protein [Histoplasma capsulatum var. duboisii H88]